MTASATLVEVDVETGATKGHPSADVAVLVLNQQEGVSGIAFKNFVIDRIEIVE